MERPRHRSLTRFAPALSGAAPAFRPWGARAGLGRALDLGAPGGGGARGRPGHGRVLTAGAAAVAEVPRLAAAPNPPAGARLAGGRPGGRGRSRAPGGRA